MVYGREAIELLSLRWKLAELVGPLVLGRVCVNLHERILRSPLPLAYAIEVRRFIFLFLLQVAVGVRFQVTEQWSLDVEAGLQHISNAGLARRNGGINNAGVTVGFTYTFGAK